MQLTNKKVQFKTDLITPILDHEILQALLFQVWPVCWLRTRRRLRNVQDMFESKIKKSNLRAEKVHQSSRSLRPHQNRRQE